jgi:hypothetical protein
VYEYTHTHTCARVYMYTQPLVHVCMCIATHSHLCMCACTHKERVEQTYCPPDKGDGCFEASCSPPPLPPPPPPRQNPPSSPARIHHAQTRLPHCCSAPRCFPRSQLHCRSQHLRWPLTGLRPPPPPSPFLFAAPLPPVLPPNRRAGPTERENCCGSVRSALCARWAWAFLRVNWKRTHSLSSTSVRGLLRVSVSCVLRD